MKVLLHFLRNVIPSSITNDGYLVSRERVIEIEEEGWNDLHPIIALLRAYWFIPSPKKCYNDYNKHQGKES